MARNAINEPPRDKTNKVSVLIVILYYFYLKLMDFRAVGHYLLLRWMHIYQDENPTSSLAQFSGIHILCDQVGNDIVFLGFGSEYSCVNCLSGHYKDQSSAGFYYFSFDIEEYLIFCHLQKNNLEILLFFF